VGVGASGRPTRGPGPSLAPDTPFDLASLTKPVVATTLARLARAGRIHLGEPLGALLVEAQDTPSAAVPLELLLAHRGGLEPHLALYEGVLSGKPLDRRRALTRACHARRGDCVGPPPSGGFAPLYSDLGYLLAGEAVSRALGKPLDALIAEEVAVPLGLELGSARQWLARRDGFTARVAPTEVVAARGGVVRGVVHDENAWAFAGHGSAGHAGMFATAEAVVRFGCALLDALRGTSTWLDRDSVEVLVRERPGGSLRAGFDGVAPAGSAAGSRMGPRAFGHLGFTGTSLWCDPDLGLVTVILTNRVHPTRDHVAIRAARPALQDALVALWAADSAVI
jgi:CubicO group peptidase (beta-lactamase class C family)